MERDEKTYELLLDLKAEVERSAGALLAQLADAYEEFDAENRGCLRWLLKLRDQHDVDQAAQQALVMETEGGTAC